MTKINSFVSKHINVHKDTGSLRASDRKIVSSRRADIEHNIFSDMSRRILKTNSFQNRRAEFRVKVNTNTGQDIEENNN
jgi:hypothetical protein